MNLPLKYAWLEILKPLPRTIAEALALYGVAEIPGGKSNSAIMAWRDELEKAGFDLGGYSNDDIPWCGLAAAIVCYRRRGIASEVVADPLWARNWAKYGEPADKASLGDVLVFVRAGGGHVAFYVGEDKGTYHVIGGNQSNTVNITRINKARCIAVRRPKYLAKPACVKPYILQSSGTISTNEA